MGLAQTFTAGTSGMVDRVSLYLGCCGDANGDTRGIPPGYGLMIEITDVDSSGTPPSATFAGWGSAIHGYGIVPSSQLSADGSLHWVDVPIIHRCGENEAWNWCTPVTAGTRYAISVTVYSTVFDEDILCDPDWQLNGDCGYQWGRTTPSAYSAGEGLGFWGRQAWVDGVYVDGTWHREDRYIEAIREYDFAFKTYITP